MLSKFHHLCIFTVRQFVYRQNVTSLKRLPGMALHR